MTAARKSARSTRANRAARTGPRRIAVREPGDLAAAVPHLLGFVPENSLVVVSTHGSDPPLLGVTARVDLPSPWHRRDVAEHLGAVLSTHGADEAHLVLVGPPEAAEVGDRPPHRELVQLLDTELDAVGVAVRHALWTPRLTAGETWCCYEDDDCTGTLADPSGTELAAASAASGAVTFGSRGELAALLSPLPPDELRHTAALLTARAPEDCPARPLGRLLEVMDHPGEHHPLTPVAVAELTASLAQPDVRAACLALSLAERAADAEQLWIALTRATPAPWRAEPACLLAIAAYVRGDGALAGMAVDNALDADPDHGLATLLRHSLDSALPPAKVRQLVRDLTAAGR